jgi:hypothetical protein
MWPVKTENIFEPGYFSDDFCKDRISFLLRNACKLQGGSGPKSNTAPRCELSACPGKGRSANGRGCKAQKAAA